LPVACLRILAIIGSFLAHYGNNTIHPATVQGEKKGEMPARIGAGGLPQEAREE